MSKIFKFFQKTPVLISLSAFLLSSSLVAATKVSYKHYFNEGVHAYNKGQYKEAERLFSDSIKANSTFSPSQVYYAVSLRTLASIYPGSDENILLKMKALNAFEEVIKVSKNFSEIDNAHSQIAGIYKELKQIENQRGWIFKRIELPEQSNQIKAQLYYSLAVSYWEESYLITQKYLIPRHQPAEYRLPSEWQEGEAEQVKKIVEKGLDCMEKSLALNPNYANCYAYRELLKLELIKADRDFELKNRLFPYEGSRDNEQFQRLNREANTLKKQTK
jgi:tetratricopeptide (TPR) repeat protein